MSRTVIVTPVEIAAAKLHIKLAERDHEEVPAPIVMIANAVWTAEGWTVFVPEVRRA